MFVGPVNSAWVHCSRTEVNIHGKKKQRKKREEEMQTQNASAFRPYPNQA